MRRYDLEIGSTALAQATAQKRRRAQGATGANRRGTTEMGQEVERPNAIRCYVGPIRYMTLTEHSLLKVPQS